VCLPASTKPGTVGQRLERSHELPSWHPNLEVKKTGPVDAREKKDKWMYVLGRGKGRQREAASVRKAL